MADNVEITAGTGTTVAADDIGGVLHQRIKIGFGADGASADVTSTNPFPIHLASFTTIPVAVGTHGVFAAGGSLTAYQGSAPWLVTMATIPVQTNVTGYALESGGNLDSIITTLNSIKTKTDNLDVTLGSRLASGGTLPITGTINALNAGGSLTAYQGGGAWLTTLATLPVVANINNSSLPVTQSGTWTVQPGNTPNTTAWLVTMATIPVVATVSVAAQMTVTAIQGDNGTKPWLMTLATLPVNVGTPSVLAAGGSLSTAQLGAWSVGQTGTWTVQPGSTPNTVGWLVTQATLPVVVGGSVTALNAGGSVTAFQGGIWNVFSSLASGTNMIAGGQYLPTLASLPSMGHTNLKTDLFSNLMVNTNVPLPNSTRFSRFLTFASYASIMAAPGAGRRLVIREMDFSGNATLTVELYEDHAGTPARVWGPHYFLPYAGFIKPTCYIPITANKSLGINITGTAFNSTLDIRIETENV